MTPASKRIQQEATHWAIRTQLGPLRPEENAQLQSWLGSDPRHKGAYVRANAIQAHIQRLAALSAGSTPSHLRVRGVRIVHSLPVVGVAAALALVALAMGTFYFWSGANSYVSGIGELRQVALEDGSYILLNTATRAVVRMQERSREVSLPRGEALFEVAKDPKRPFLVHAGNVTVKAVGTAFSVRNDDDRIDVTVTEGVVELIRTDGVPPQRLAADHQATITRARVAQIQTLEPRETERQLAWSTGWLEFDGQPLSEAVEQINRHNRRHIVVTDPQLAQRPIVGSFRAIDSQAFANIAAAALNAQVTEDGDTIRIEPKSSR